MKVIITCEVEEFWGSKESLNSLPDAELIELFHEDIIGLMGHATWEIVR